MYVDAVSDQIDVEDYIHSVKVVCWNGRSIKELSSRDAHISFPEPVKEQSKYSLRGKMVDPMMVKATVSYEQDGVKAEISAQYDFSDKESSGKDESSSASNDAENESVSAEVAENTDK